MFTIFKEVKTKLKDLSGNGQLENVTDLKKTQIKNSVNQA